MEPGEDASGEWPTLPMMQGSDTNQYDANANRFQYLMVMPPDYPEIPRNTPNFHGLPPIPVILLDQLQIGKHAMDSKPEAVNDLVRAIRFDDDQHRLIDIVIGLESDAP